VGSLLGDAFTLVGRAISSSKSVGLPASQLAPVVVMAGRQLRGLYPSWPKVLAVLTGVMKPVTDQHQGLVQELLVQA
jgi:hypothetical protein